MDFEKTKETLRDLLAQLCTAVRRAEWVWYGMASDYQSKYAFTADYDTAFKQGYNEKASYCRETAEWLEGLPLPSAAEGVAAFVAKVTDAARRCPQRGDMEEQLETLIEKMEKIVATIDAP